MKNTSIGFKITTAVLCLVTVGYFCLQAYRYFTDPLTTSPAYTYQVEQSVTVTLPSDVIYVSGTVNGIEYTWTNTEGYRWEAVVARTENEI